MKKVAIPTLIFLALLVSGCSSVVKLNVKHAPQIDLGAVQTIAVRDFSVSGQVNLDVVNDRDVMRNMVKSAIVSNLVAPSDLNVQKQHHAALVEALLRNSHYRVSNGEGDATLSGHIEYKVADSMTEKEWKDAESGKKQERYTLQRVTTAVVSFEVADRSGVVLGASSVEHALSEKWEGKSRQEARSQAENQAVADDVLLAVTKTAAPLVRKIAPHWVMESRVLEDGDGDKIEQGNKAAESGRWEEAAQLWRSGLYSANKEDRVAALYNLSIYDEYAGDLDAALLKLERLYADTRDIKFDQAANRMRQRINEALQMRRNAQLRGDRQPE